MIFSQCRIINASSDIRLVHPILCTGVKLKSKGGHCFALRCHYYVVAHQSENIQSVNFKRKGALLHFLYCLIHPRMIFGYLYMNVVYVIYAALHWTNS